MLNDHYTESVTLKVYPRRTNYAMRRLEKTQDACLTDTVCGMESPIPKTNLPPTETGTGRTPNDPSAPAAAELALPHSPMVTILSYEIFDIFDSRREEQPDQAQHAQRT
jgi:hypothetical protein